MDDLNCQGTESSLEQCPFPGWDVQNCGHSEDVGVNCYGDGGSTPPPLTTTSTSRTTAEPGMNSVAANLKLYCAKFMFSLSIFCSISHGRF